jgi:tetratricopeptide (TPR) repeat protein
MGTLHQSLNELEKAREYHKEALALTNELEMNVEMVEVLTGIGLDFHLSGDDENALDNLNRALETVEKLGLRDAEMMVLNALSEVWLSKGNLVKAREYCDRVLKRSEKEGLKDYKAWGKKIKGEILLQVALGSSSGSKRKKADASGKRSAVSSGSVATPVATTLKKAEKELKEALKIAQEIGASPLLWQVHASLGKLYQEAGAEEKAKEQFSKAKEIIDEIASKIGDEKLKETFLNSKQIQSVMEM